MKQFDVKRDLFNNVDLMSIRRHVKLENRTRREINLTEQEILEKILFTINTETQCSTSIGDGYIYVKFYKSYKNSIEDVEKILNDFVRGYNEELNYRTIFNVDKSCSADNIYYIKLKKKVNNVQ